MSISDFHLGSCRGGDSGGSEGDEGDNDHQQALLEDGDDQGEEEGSGSPGHKTKKTKNKGDKRESQVRGCLTVRCLCLCVGGEIMLSIGACWRHSLFALLAQTSQSERCPFTL